MPPDLLTRSKYSWRPARQATPKSFAGPLNTADWPMRMVLSVTPLSARAGRSRPGPSARAAPPATRGRLEIESFMRRLSLCCCCGGGVAGGGAGTSSSSAGLDAAGLDALDALGRHLLPGGGQRAVEVD